MLFRLAVAAASLVAAAPSASAQIIRELRVGAIDTNICITNCDNTNQEDGFNIEAEVVFAPPKRLRYIGSPRPFLVASINTAGDTSFGGFGLVWNWDFLPGWSLEPSFGYVVHSGAIDVPLPIGPPENAEINNAFDEDNVLFGSRDLFRSTLALNRDITKRLGIQVIYEHLSHGQILGSGRNQGSDNLGGRFYYRFGALGG